MGMRELENGILEELKEVAGNLSIKKKDMMEWRTSEIKPQDGEVVLYLPKVGVYVAIKKELKKK